MAKMMVSREKVVTFDEREDFEAKITNLDNLSFNVQINQILRDLTRSVGSIE